MMVKIEDLTHLQLDVLREIGNIGAGHATTALSQLLGEKIEMTVPDISILPLNEVSEVLGGPEKLVVGIYMRVFGDAPGKIIFLFTPIEALTLTDMALKWKVGTSQSLREFEESAMKEIGNIMTGAYIYALTKLTGYNLLTSVPAFACDMVGAIINTALMDLGVVGDYTLLIKTQFSLTHRKINGHFFLVPDPGALELIMDALGVGPICKK